jgi:plastocyanin
MSFAFSRRARLAAALGVVATAGGLTACSGGSHSAMKPAAAATVAPTAPDHDAMPMPNAAAPSSAAPVATSAVTIDNFAFSPSAITVKAGTTVTWTNRDEEPHSVVSSEEPMRSPTLAGKTNTFSHTFAKPGTYHYNCGIHPFMHGTVEVTP